MHQSSSDGLSGKVKDEEMRSILIATVERTVAVLQTPKCNAMPASFFAQ